MSEANDRAGILSDNTTGSSETRVSVIVRNILYYWRKNHETTISSKCAKKQPRLSLFRFGSAVMPFSKKISRAQADLI